ncbi:hypothetical protein V8F20_006040 [Naviculisporaceae sp. PSN 640]
MTGTRGNVGCITTVSRCKIRHSGRLVCRAVRSDGSELGFCEARMFTRDASDRIPLNFWRRMRGLRNPTLGLSGFEIEHEAERLAYDLFDYQTIGGRGPKLEELMFKDLLNTAECLLGKVPGGHNMYYVFARVPMRDPLMNYMDRHHAQSLYWSLKFRRVGNTAWFARARELNDPRAPKHPSFSIEDWEDWSIPPILPPSPRIAADASDLFNIMILLYNDDLALATIRGILEGKDREYKEAFWNSRIGEDGDTLLHAAAKTFKPKTMNYILSMVSMIATWQNIRRYTALQALEDELDKLQWPFLSERVDYGDVSAAPYPFPPGSEECWKTLRRSTLSSETLLDLPQHLRGFL